MDYAEVSAKIASIQSEIEGLLAKDELEPAIRAGLESAKAHVDLLCIELALDVE